VESLLARLLAHTISSYFFAGLDFFVFSSLFSFVVLFVVVVVAAAAIVVVVVLHRKKWSGRSKTVTPRLLLDSVHQHFLQHGLVEKFFSFSSCSLFS
jgi:hypothetical protein